MAVDKLMCSSILTLALPRNILSFILKYDTLMLLEKNINKSHVQVFNCYSRIMCFEVGIIYKIIFPSSHKI